jgi:23S rRNA (adenine2030-N6)-methyltransferase
MKYRHQRHAGNFADVHKHVALLALLDALQRKPKGLLYLDTHAGRGRYELPSGAADADAVHESTGGVLRLLLPGDGDSVPEIAAYSAAVRSFRALPGNAHACPGSPALALARLRDVDRAILVEAQHEEFLALRRGFEHGRRVQLRHGDGFAALAAELPPIERRALVLVDPPYEETRADYDRVRTGLRDALRRFATGVIAIWYPIKLARDAQDWRASLAAGLGRPLLFCELWVHPTDSRVGLNGSGLAIANPPYQVEERMRAWLPPLSQRLAAGAGGGWSVTSAS